MSRLRGKLIAQMLISLRSEGTFVCHDDDAMISAYVQGNVSGKDLLAHICQCPDLSSYQQWLRLCLDQGVDQRHSQASVEQLVTELKIGLRRKHEVAERLGFQEALPCIDIDELLRQFRLANAADVPVP